MTVPLESKRRMLRAALIMALIVFLTSLALYLTTVRSQIGPSLDSTELHLAAVTNGVVHPPGSPQYVVLTYLATFVLPGPDAAYRVNLFSALMMALGVMFLYLTTYRITWHIAISALAALAFAAAPRMWYLASVAELYALNTFYIGLLLYLLITWHQTRHDALYWGAAIIYAWSFGNHTSMILLLPAFLYMVWITNRSMLLRPRNFVLTVVIVLLAALQYAAIPIRMRQGALYCNFCTEMESVADFVDYVSGGPFKGAFFDVGRRDMLIRTSESMQQLSIQFMPWGIALGVIGLWEMAKHQIKMALLFGGSMLIAWVFVMGYNIPDWHDFLMPAYALFTPLIGYGMLRVWQALQPRLDMITQKPILTWAQRWVGPAFAGGALMVLAVMTIMGFRDASQATQIDWDIKAHALLAAPEGEEAMLLMPYTFSAGYYFGYSVPYYAHVDQIENFTSVPPYDLAGLPLGQEPLYRAYPRVKGMLTPSKLREAANAGTLPRLYIIDPTEPRFKDYGLLPICVPGQDLIAGYEVVAVRDGDQEAALVASQEWEQIQSRVVFPGEEASCE